MDFINEFPIKFFSYDPVAAVNPDNCVKVPREAISGTDVMKDISSTLRRGCMRQGADIYRFPEPDVNDPHCVADKVRGVLTWSSKYILREYYGFSTFYRSGIQFQKHQNLAIRFLDLRRGVNDVGPRTAHINRVVPHSFVNTSKSSRAAETRRPDNA